MILKFKYQNKKSKNKMKKISLEYFNNDGILVILLKLVVALLSSEAFLGFVVKIVKYLMNGSFYYFKNNRIFSC